MNEISFLYALHEQMVESKDTKFKAPLEWAKGLCKAINSAGGNTEYQNCISANIAAEIVSNVNMIEHTGVAVDPVGIATSLDAKDPVYPVYYYRHDKAANTVTVDIQLYNTNTNKANTTIKHGVLPLVIAVDPSLLTKPEDDSKSIILA